MSAFQVLAGCAETLGCEQSTELLRRRGDELPFWIAVTRLRGIVPSGPDACRAAPALGSSIGASEPAALVSALAEALERWYLAAEPRATVSGRARDLSGRVLTEAEWPTYTDEQLAAPGFPWRPYDLDEERRWVRLEPIAGREPMWVPASLVWLVRGKDRFMPAVSSGAAAHLDVHLATLTGLFEVIERDAFTIAWEARAVTPLLDPRADWQSPDVQAIAGYFRRRGLAFLLRDLTTDLGIPCVLAVIRDPEGRRPALAIGAACRLDRVEACRKAAEEAYHTWTWMRDEHRHPPLAYEQARQALAIPDAMRWHGYLYGFPEASAAAAHFLSDAPWSTRPDEPVAPASASPAQRVQAVARRLVERGHEPFGIDLLGTPGPLVVRKTFVTGLVPLSVGTLGRHLAHPRLREVPRALAWPHAGPLAPALAQPHPLP